MTSDSVFGNLNFSKGGFEFEICFHIVPFNFTNENLEGFCNLKDIGTKERLEK
jgi:hypothetical protein